MFVPARVARRAIRAAIALAVLSSPAFAQLKRSPVDAGHGGFQLGIMMLDVDDMNAALTTAGFPEFKDQFMSVGGYGYGQRGRWLIGGEGAALISNEPATTLFSLQAGGGYGMFRIGYDLVANESVDLYPSMGFGAGGVSVSIRGRTTPTFTDVLNNPARSSRLSSGGMLLGVGINGNFRLQLDQRDGNVGGMLFGVAAGYIFAPGVSAWKLDEENSVAGGPELKVQGLYVRMTFGGWGKPAPK